MCTMTTSERNGPSASREISTETPNEKAGVRTVVRCVVGYEAYPSNLPRIQALPHGLRKTDSERLYLGEFARCLHVIPSLELIDRED